MPRGVTPLQPSPVALAKRPTSDHWAPPPSSTGPNSPEHRARWDANGKVAAPADAVRNWSGSEVWAPSLAGAVRYAHKATGLPILVTEHGVGTNDDAIRARFIPAAVQAVRRAMDDGVPVLGYIHWSLLDNFEWFSGYGPKFGLVAVDRATFQRAPKPSARLYSKIVRAGGKV